MKTALAPTVELAEPKVKKFTEKVREFFGRDAEILNFYTCDPSELYVSNSHGEKWTEGSWGLRILATAFDTETLPDLIHLSGAIEVSSVYIKPHSAGKIELSIWLTARVMR